MRSFSKADLYFTYSATTPQLIQISIYYDICFRLDKFLVRNEKSEIEVSDLPDEIIDTDLHSSELLNEALEKPIYSKKINKNKIRDVLIKHHNGLNLAATELNMSRTTLCRYRKKFNL